MMHLNQLKPAPGSKISGKRLGRGIGSGKGKTAGRGHKGQHARAGGYHKVGFEGGQMPIQRRVPKFGFTSRQSLCREEIRLSDLEKLSLTVVDFKSLKYAGVLKATTKHIKVIASGTLTKAITLKGIRATAGARTAIENAGGTIED